MEIERAARSLGNAHVWLSRHQENTGEVEVRALDIYGEADPEPSYVEVPEGVRLVDVDPVDLSEPGDPGPHAEWTVYCPRGCSFGDEAVQPTAAAAIEAANRHRVAFAGHEAHVIVG